jgi:hypothetical protein
MMPLTCAQIEEQIDLYAAGECDILMRQAIEKHLAECPPCRATLREAEQLVAFLDLQLRQDDNLRRLQTKIATEARPLRSRASGGSGRRSFLALAALLLATLGVWWMLPAPQTDADLSASLAISLQPPAAGDARFEHHVAVGVASPKRATTGNLAYVLDVQGETTAAFQTKLKSARSRDDLPSPPEVDLNLRIHNNSNRIMRVWLGGSYSTLSLDLQGPGAVSVPVPGPAASPLGPARLVQLAPGATHLEQVTRLVSGSDKEVRYLYWTEPGTYTLTVQLRTLVCWGGPPDEHCSRQTITGPPLSLAVEASAPANR